MSGYFLINSEFTIVVWLLTSPLLVSMDNFLFFKFYNIILMQSLNHRYVFKFYFTRIFASMEFSNNFSNTKYISHLKSNNSKVITQLLSLVAEKKYGRVSFPFGVGEILSVVSFPYKYCLSLWFIYPWSSTKRRITDWVK